MIRLFKCVALLCLVPAAVGQIYPFTDNHDTEGNVSATQMDQLQEFQGLFKLIKNQIETGLTNLGSYDVSYNCLNDTKVVIAGIRYADMNAIMFLDADVKPPSGILNGNLYWTGDYSECLSIKLRNPYTNRDMKGKYFSVIMKPPSILPVPGILVGVCLPNSCDASDANNLLKLAVSGGRPSNTSSVEAVFDIEKPTMSSEQAGTITVVVFLILIVAIGTAIDVYEIYFGNKYAVMQNGDVNKSTSDVNDTPDAANKLSGPIHPGETEAKPKRGIFRAFKTFSVVSNTKKLANTSTANGPLACLNGMRVLSICWVIQGHTYEFTAPFLSNSKYATQTLSSRYSFQAIVNGTFSVDTFFFMSGLLVAYLALKEIKTKGRLNWPYYFGHRIWRLTPMYAFVLLCFTTLAPHLVHGPFRVFITEKMGFLYKQVHQCRDTWWSNLLYFNNLYPDYGSLSGCMAWTWYLANDMQFYIFIAPLVIIFFNKNKIAGLVYSGLLILAGVSIRGGLATYYDMNQAAQPSKHLDSPWVKNGPIYQYPFTRFSVYVVGLVTGFVLHHSNCKVKLSKWVTVVGWLLASGVGYIVVYGLYYYNSHGTDMLPFGSRLYVATGRTAWSVCLAWLVIACASGRGGWVNSILSLKIWAPLGRLTYAAYLIHPIVIVVFWGNQTSSIQFTDLFLVYIFVSNVVLVYGLSYLVSMIVEAPMMQLEKIILGR